MENLKIRVNNADESKEAQELFFELGGSWAGYKKINDWPEIKQLYLSENYITFSNDINFFVKAHKEVTLPELRAMINPVKEYLEPLRYGGYKYHKDPDAYLSTWLEIHKDAEFAVLNGNNEVDFYTGSALEKSHFIPESIVWQREQDEPFLTPECTLNDQYAEIEEVRQHKKHERNSSAWNTQVGGSHYKQFKIQPMQFALENKLDAAQQNVIKYIMRHSFKNGKQDLEKAKHYIDLMIEFYYGDNNNG